MNFSQLEMQQVINSCLCLGDNIKYIDGSTFVEKSLNLLKIIVDIKNIKGTVEMFDIQQAIIR